MKKVIGIPQQNDDGIVVKLSSREDLINEIVELRKALLLIQHDLKKVQSTNAYNGKCNFSNYERRYIQEALGRCSSQLFVQYVSE